MFKMKMRLQVRPLGVLNKMVIDKEEEIKRINVLILIVVFLVFSFGSMVIAGREPAPNSDDGIPDGPGWF